jgi:prolipoprotein diacylglyceryltransferase
VPKPSSIEIELIKRLQELGVKSPLRARRLIQKAIQSMELDLSGLVVLTEAATRNYVYTTIIAAMAGARIVYGLTQNSNYGSVQEVTK